jgi:hypothetical protein
LPRLPPPNRSSSWRDLRRPHRLWVWVPSTRSSRRPSSTAPLLDPLPIPHPPCPLAFTTSQCTHLQKTSWLGVARCVVWSDSLLVSVPRWPLDMIVRTPEGFAVTVPVGATACRPWDQS